MNEIILKYVRHNLEQLAMAHAQPTTGKMNTYAMVMLVPLDDQNPQTMWNVLFSAPWLDKLSERDVLIELYQQIKNQSPFSDYSSRNGRAIYAFRPIHTKDFLVKNYHQSLRYYNGFDVAVYTGDSNIPTGYVIDSQLLKNLYVGNTLTIQVKDKGEMNVEIINLTKQGIIVKSTNPYIDQAPQLIEYGGIIDIKRQYTQPRQNIYAQRWA